MRRSFVCIPDKTALAVFAACAVCCVLAACASSVQGMGAAESPETGNGRPLVYEERLGSVLEEKVKKVDYALVATAENLGLESGRLTLMDVDIREYGDGVFHFQIIDVALDGPPQPFLSGLETLLAELAPDAEVRQASATGWQIRVDGVPTHDLVFRIPSANVRPMFPSINEVPDGVGLLSIIIDDLGENVSFAQDLTGLRFPVTFSIWPRASQADMVAAIARNSGREIIIHQPMEPLDSAMRPGPGALYEDMDLEEIRRLVRENIKLAPNAVGMNNHMGSRLTQNREAMRIVCEELEKYKLFAVDSYTHPKSVFGTVAGEEGLRTWTRDVFLDVVRDNGAILHQLKKAERVALKQGRAVVIGHPYPETLWALRAWASQRDNRVLVVPLSTLLSPDGTVAKARDSR